MQFEKSGCNGKISILKIWTDFRCIFYNFFEIEKLERTPTISFDSYDTVVYSRVAYIEHSMIFTRSSTARNFLYFTDTVDLRIIEKKWLKHLILFAFSELCDRNLYIVRIGWFPIFLEKIYMSNLFSYDLIIRNLLCNRKVIFQGFFRIISQWIIVPFSDSWDIVFSFFCEIDSDVGIERLLICRYWYFWWN